MRDARTNRKDSPPSFPALVQQFFTEYLVAQRALSSRTVASYRDAMTMFLGCATQDLGKTPMAVQPMDITPELVLKFLAHMERERHNPVRSRNLRLTALRAFLKFAGRRDEWSRPCESRRDCCSVSHIFSFDAAGTSTAPAAQAPPASTRGIRATGGSCGETNRPLTAGERLAPACTLVSPRDKSTVNVLVG